MKTAVEKTFGLTVVLSLTSSHRVCVQFQWELVVVTIQESTSSCSIQQFSYQEVHDVMGRDILVSFLGTLNLNH